MMHFPTLFQISPLFSNIFLIFWKISEILPFPDKISYFHPPKFLTTFFLFFSHRPQISNFPRFACLTTFPPLIRENFLFPPTFQNFLPVFEKFNSFLHTLRVISPPTLTMMHLCITQCTYWTPLLDSTQIQRLQLIQNSLARAVTRTPRHHHITPVLKSLHWLKIPERIHFKVLSLLQSIKHHLHHAPLSVTPGLSTRNSSPTSSNSLPLTHLILFLPTRLLNYTSLNA